jgi:hypothetical protein
VARVRGAADAGAAIAKPGGAYTAALNAVVMAAPWQQAAQALHFESPEEERGPFACEWGSACPALACAACDACS